MIKVIASVSLFLVAGFGPAVADIYKMKGKDGNVYFTDNPPTVAGQLKVLKKYRFGSVRRRAPVGYLRMSFSGKYDRLIRSAAEKYNIDADLVKSVIKVESDFDQHTVSRKGAKGLMQLMPMTAKYLEVTNVFDARQNIFGGAKYLKKMLREFGGSLRLALAAYNAGPTAVRKYNGIPPYRETREYVRKVLAARRALNGTTQTRRAPPAYSPGMAPRQKAKLYYVRENRSGARVYSDNPIGTKKILRY